MDRVGRVSLVWGEYGLWGLVIGGDVKEGGLGFKCRGG